jgi:adenine phosphoribosyltransferase
MFSICEMLMVGWLILLYLSNSFITITGILIGFIIWIIYRIAISIDKKCRDETGEATYNYLFANVHILKKKKHVQAVLNGSSQLPYLNSIFNSAHGMEHTINNYDTTHPNWRILHKCLKETITQILSDKSVDSLMVDAFNGNISTATDTFNIDDFVMTFWSTIMFGPNTKTNFQQHRTNILYVLNYTFYDNPFHKIPLLGNIVAWYRLKHVKSKMTQIKCWLDDMKILSSRSYFATIFYRTLQKYVDIDDKTKNLIEQLYLDNMMLSFLVYDFVLLVIKGIMIQTTRGLCNEPEALLKSIGSDNPTDNKQIKNIISKNFLYPVRCRYMTSEIILGNGTVIKPGDYCLLNLIKADLYFSYGGRRCVGYLLVNNIIYNLLKIMSMYHIYQPDQQPIKYHQNPDIGQIISQHTLVVKEKSRFSGRMLVRKTADNIPMMNINLLYTNPGLISAVVQTACQIIKDKNITYLVAPDARGFPIAGAIQYASNLPLALIRKKGKIMGPVKSQQYYCGHNKDKLQTMEISTDYKLTGQKVMLIDDGISSGGTALACIILIEQMGAEVVSIYTIVSHRYCPLNKNFKLYEDITDSFIQLH